MQLIEGSVDNLRLQTMFEQQQQVVDDIMEKRTMPAYKEKWKMGKDGFGYNMSTTD